MGDNAKFIVIVLIINLYIMNKKIIFALALATTVLFSCKDKTKDTEPTTNTVAEWSSTVQTSDMRTYLNGKAPAFVSYTLNASTGGTITNDSVKVNFLAGSFANEDGSPFMGTVTLKMQTIRTIKDMIYSGVTTTASNGELIISDGMFKLEAYDSGKNSLKLRAGMTYSAEFPRFNSSNIAFEGIPTEGNNKIEWNEWDSTSTRGQASTTISGLNKLFTFCNLDRYMNETPLTDITISTPIGYTNLNTECFMKYSGEMASAYVPSNSTLKKFTTQGAYYKVVVGRGAKIICFATKGGKFYYDIQTIGSIVANQSVNITTMTETTEANLQTIIAAF